MGQLTLQRFRAEGGLGGVLHVPGLDWLPSTIERDWLGNERMVSCIPAGTYELRWHGSAKFPLAWALVGPGVWHYPSNAGPHERYAVLIHPANQAWQLNGCIAPGRNFSRFRLRGRQFDEMSVSASRWACERIQRVIGDGSGWKIEIRNPV